jgi:hypothetical protein
VGGDLWARKLARKLLDFGLFFGERVQSPGHVRSYLL